MGQPHYFSVNDMGEFSRSLKERGYEPQLIEEPDGQWTVFSKTLSGAVAKFYAHPVRAPGNPPYEIRITYSLVKEGKPLGKIITQLKKLNWEYRQVTTGWKTKRRPRKGLDEKRRASIQDFLKEHAELIDCFRYEGDNQLTEGNPSFNLQIASTPNEQKTCLQVIQALSEAFSPHGLVRGRRQVDQPRQQRNGWIKRYAGMHKKRGWSNSEIAKEIQRELRNGTWDERTRRIYNLGDTTICKIAGLKLETRFRI